MSDSYSLRPLGLLLVLVVAYANVWMWTSDTLVLGVPVNLLYHMGLCVMTTVAIPIVLRNVWPAEDADEPVAGSSDKPEDVA